MSLILFVGAMRSSTEPVVAVAAVPSKDQEALPKGDNIRVIEMERKLGLDALQSAMSTKITEPKPVQTETIVPPVPVTAEPDDPPTRKHRVRTASHDICRGKGKRYINGGRSWRCRR